MIETHCMSHLNEVVQDQITNQLTSRQFSRQWWSQGNICRWLVNLPLQQEFHLNFLLKADQGERWGLTTLSSQHVSKYYLRDTLSPKLTDHLWNIALSHFPWQLYIKPFQNGPTYRHTYKYTHTQHHVVRELWSWTSCP